MDKITELYARNAYRRQDRRSAFAEFRSYLGVGVVAVGLCLNVLLPFALGWWLWHSLGLR